MRLTLLLDLDDTLLYNDMDTFIPAYLQALAGYMADRTLPQRFTQVLLEATQRMFQNRLPTRSLQETFEQAFYPALNLDPQALQPHIAGFYRQVFPTLQPLTRPREGGRALVQRALEQGWRLILATNPIFPRTAIEQRLTWAGLEPSDFAMLTSYEEFHFSKPHPAYYAEILGRIGWPEGPVLMAGNDPELDIRPALQAGLHAWHVTASPQEAAAPPADGRGPLEALLSWLETRPAAALQDRYETPQAALATLRATPAVLDTWRRTLPPEAWLFSPGGDSWSLTENVCHLRDSDLDVNLPRVQAALHEDNPFIPAVDADAWAQERNYRCENGLEAVQRFTEARLRLLRLLENLPPHAWQRTVRHGIFGPTTLEELVIFMAAHDRSHLHTIHALIAAHTAGCPRPH